MQYGKRTEYWPAQAVLGSGESELRAYPRAHIPAVHVTVVPTAVQLKQLAPQPAATTTTTTRL